MDYFVAYVERYEREDDLLELEATNIFAALKTASEQKLHHSFVRGINAFAFFLIARNLYVQAEDLLAQAIEATAAHQYDELRTATLLHLGIIALKRGAYAQAHTVLDEGLALARSKQQPERTIDILRQLASVARVRGNYIQATTYIEEGLSLARQRQHSDRLCLLLLDFAILTSISRQRYLHDLHRRARDIY